MAEIKLRVLNEFGMPQFLGKPDEIEAFFPFEENGPLVKKMTYGHIEILDDAKGEIKINFSPLDVAGFPVGDAQSFTVKIYNGPRIKEAIFPKSFNVRTMQVEGQNRKVIFK